MISGVKGELEKVAGELRITIRLETRQTKTESVRACIELSWSRDETDFALYCVKHLVMPIVEVFNATSFVFVGLQYESS